MAATGYLNAVGFVAASAGTADFVVSTNVIGYQTPASANAVGGTSYSYRAESSNRNEWEEGTGNYASGTLTLSRTSVSSSSNGGSLVNFSAAPNVFIVALAADLQSASLITSGTIGSSVVLGAGVTATTQAQGDNSTKVATTAYADRYANAALITSGTLGAAVALGNGVTGTTQAQADNSTKIATTAYADRAAYTALHAQIGGL